MQTDMLNDHELIQKFQKGDQEAFNEIVRQHLPKVIGFFINITHDKMTAEDLAQDVFYKLYKYLKTFRFESAFTTYLYRTNINTANSWIARNKWKNILHLDQGPDPSEHDNRIEKEWTKQELWSAIKRLPKKQRTVVMMRVAQELSYKEISKVTGMSEATAKVNFHYGVKTLKRWFSND